MTGDPRVCLDLTPQNKVLAKTVRGGLNVKHVASLPSKQELLKGAHLIQFILSQSLARSYLKTWKYHCLELQFP